MMVDNINKIMAYFTLRKHSNLISAVKDNELHYIAATDQTAQLLGFKNANDFIGKTDSELLCAAANSAELFMASDKTVIQNKKLSHYISFNEYIGGWHLFSTIKAPLLDINNECIGIELITQDITEYGILNAGILLSEILSTKIKRREAFHSSLQTQYRQCKLSRRESLCTFYFFHGYKIKAIAKQINVSPASVETYLKRVMCKLDCENRGQLIEKMHFLNLADMLLI